MDSDAEIRMHLDAMEALIDLECHFHDHQQQASPSVVDFGPVPPSITPVLGAEDVSMGDLNFPELGSGHSDDSPEDEQTDSQDQCLQELEAFTANLQPVSPVARTGWSTWNKRGHAWHQSFIALRPTLLQADLLRHAVPEATGCGNCGRDIARILCLDCAYPGGILLCGGCDWEAHPYAHLHRRQHVVNNRLVPMHPLKGTDGHGNIVERGLCLDVRPLVCMSCGSEEEFEAPKPTTETLTVFMHGRHDFKKGRCACSNCGVSQVQGLADFVRAGFWPASPSSEKFETLIDQRVFQRYAAVKDRALDLSTKVWLEAFATEGCAYGGKGEKISADAFSAAFREWQYMQHDIREYMQFHSDLQCAACSPTPHSLHMDANMKLFVYDRHRQPWLEAYHVGKLFLSSEDCVQHMHEIDRVMGKQVDDRTCKGLWAAAGDQKSRSDKMSITGSSFTVCRHQIPFAAVNLIRTGERYAYSHFMMTEKILAAYAPKFIHQDIACKHKPWRQRVEEAVRRQPQPMDGTATAQRMSATAEAAAAIMDVLPEAHGLLHSWACQVLFSALWTDGAAAGSGEDAELLFSFLSTAASPTRHMSEAGRDDRLTGACLLWARRKRQVLPQLLHAKQDTKQGDLIEARATLDEACMQLLGQPSATSTATIPSLIAQIKELARSELQRSRQAISVAMDFFMVSQRIADGEALLPFVGGLKEQAARTLAAKNGDLAQLHTLAAGLVADLASLKSRRDLLRVKVVAALGASTNFPADRLHEATFNDVAEEYIIEHQNKLEGLVVQRHQHWNRLQHYARTSKEKTKFKGKLRTDDKQLQDAVVLYNNLIPFGKTARPTALTVEELTRQPPEFPWALEATRGLDERTLLHRLGTYASIRLCEAFLKVQRLEEEQVLIPKECKQYVFFCEEVGAQQAQAMSDVLCGRSLVEIFAPEARSGRYFAQDAFTAVTCAQEDRLRSGVLAVLAEGSAEVEGLLGNARKYFGAAATPTTQAEPGAFDSDGGGSAAAMEAPTATDEGSNPSYVDEDQSVGSLIGGDVGSPADSDAGWPSDSDVGSLSDGDVSSEEE